MIALLLASSLALAAGAARTPTVEQWPVAKMRALADENGDAFPPATYWRRVSSPGEKRYGVSPLRAYTREGMDGVPVDDDITYTQLGLLILEDHLNVG